MKHRASMSQRVGRPHIKYSVHQLENWSQSLSWRNAANTPMLMLFITSLQWFHVVVVVVAVFAFFWNILFMQYKNEKRIFQKLYRIRVRARIQHEFIVFTCPSFSHEHLISCSFYICIPLPFCCAPGHHMLY